MWNLVTTVTHPLYESRMRWIPDPTPPPPRRTGMDYSDPLVQSSGTPVQTRNDCLRPCDTPVKSRSAQTKSVLPLCILVIPRRPPLPQVPHQEFLSPCLSPENAGEGGGERLAAQPMKMQRLAQLPRWPRMSAGPIRMQGSRERPSISQGPVTPPRWWVLRCTRTKASTLLISHSLPSQRPIEIQHSLLDWSAVNFQAYINRPFQTSGRIWLLEP